eukprot:2899943-Prymnesium_polylepis.1
MQLCVCTPECTVQWPARTRSRCVRGTSRLALRSRPRGDVAASTVDLLYRLTRDSPELLVQNEGGGSEIESLPKVAHGKNKNEDVNLRQRRNLHPLSSIHTTRTITNGGVVLFDGNEA